MSKVHVIILAGGNGDRLWPLSSPERPKQLLPFLRNKTLLDLSLERAALLAEPTNICVVTCAQQEQAVRRSVGGRATVLVEPAQKNTGPAILFALWQVKLHDPEAMVMVMPSDGYIDDNQECAVALRKAARVAQKNNGLVLLGVVPTSPATGYGYIEYFADGQPEKAYPIISFHEKPDLAKAEEYVARSTMLWNTGIVIGSIKTFMQQFLLLAPDMYAAMDGYFHAAMPYSVVPSISFDYAVMEKTIDAFVLPVFFGWSDVGNLKTFVALSQQASNLLPELLEINAKNNITQVLNKPVVCIGVNNLCVIETAHALVIVHQQHLEEIRQAVAIYKQRYGSKEMSI
jgi:mannose-1-phosphate guanylyltransferase